MELSKLLFDSWQDVVRTILAGIVAYTALVLLLRISGKRTLAKLNAFDLVVSVAIGSTLATILLSADVALAEGITAFIVLILLQWIVARCSTVWPWFKEVTRSEPRLLFENGEFIEKAIYKQRVTHAEIQQAVRNEGFGDMKTIAAVVLETDGSFSVIPRDKAGDGTAFRSLKKREGESIAEDA